MTLGAGQELEDTSAACTNPWSSHSSPCVLAHPVNGGSGNFCPAGRSDPSTRKPGHRINPFIRGEL